MNWQINASQCSGRESGHYKALIYALERADMVLAETLKNE